MNNAFKILLCLLIWHANSFAQSVTTSEKCQITTHYKIMTHEVGHWANLNHTFNVGCNGIGDSISDTSLYTKGSGCNLTNSPCGTLANHQNYMDYGDCTVMLTEVQKSRMEATVLLQEIENIANDYKA